jgi:DNA-binding ferritin-like protein
MTTLATLASLLRSLQLYAHNAHHTACGESFFADHKFLGSTYAAYEEAYDSVIELAIGEGMAFSLVELQREAVTLLEELSRMEIDPLATLWRGEGQIQSLIDGLCAGQSDQGIVQVLGTIAQQSKERRYKLGRRIEAFDTGDKLS